MRTIDADALFTNLDGMMAVSPTGYIHGDTVADMISDAPTVDAVPVEFIKEVITRLRRRRMNLDDDFVDEAWDLKMQIEALDDLLNEWAERKEE